MVLTVCPKCRHEFPPTASPLEPAPLLPTTPQLCPCPRSVGPTPAPAPSLGGGAVPAAWLPPAQPPGPVSSPTPSSAMLSLSITASSAASLNGGHVVVKTTPSVAAPTISVTATLPAVAPMWAWNQPAPVSVPSMAPAPTWAMMPTPWAMPQPTPTWPTQTGPVPAPLTLGLELIHGPLAHMGVNRPRQPLSQPHNQPPVWVKGAQYRLTGGGILHERGQQGQQEAPVLLQPRGKPTHPPQVCGSASGVAPEQSPSTPLSFVLPGGVALAGLSVDLHAVVPEACPAPAHQPAPEVGSNPEAELRLLQATTQALQTSGWYYEGFSWQESAATLRDAAPGTFLVRDSSDPRFLFSLSVQTDRGPTSVRLLYVAGGFRLDAEPHLAPTMPLFPCVLQLIEHYMDHRGKRGSAPVAAAAGASAPRNREQVWVDARGQVYSHILLTAPRRHTVPGLQHLARLAVHKQLKAAATTSITPQQRSERIAKMELPTTLCRFLDDYPYAL
ncbi:uncharacterized protein LOC113205597 [Frankliniella occidentalis]|uniref:Uncharacterized protein LOC113205597 n=1 Tax=Frankliniella occidentalis TaxID=133901 RepID=A0A9C6XA31_FRAOC|nr:uncharacterized protein LOC113205597 [Frankliniella occidentalis]